MISTIREALEAARELGINPVADFLFVANAAVWGTVLALLWGGLLS
ncbi:hypothetical protein [Novosphingobium sp. NDB2Meth1]|nr:hypothetical protein [Novosphingobium sp. NDB2Meth1]